MFNDEKELEIPYDLIAEKAVISSILMDKDSSLIANDILKANDFFDEKNVSLFKTISILRDKNIGVDLVSLQEELTRQGLLNSIGGISYIGSLMDEYVTSANIEHYCNIVKEKSILRNLILASKKIIKNSKDKKYKSSELLEMAQESIFNISKENAKGSLEDISSVLIETLKTSEVAYNSKGGLRGISTGFLNLDKNLSGLQRSDLVLIAARPSMGKTSFAINVALNAAKESSIAIFSLEMSKNQIGQRIGASNANMDLKKIIDGKLVEEEWIKFVDTISGISKRNIVIDDTPGISLSELRTKCRKIKMEKGLDIILIDYLQLMRGEGKSENRQQEISKISRGLKGLAKELDCTVIALSQLSRASELRSDHRPILSDLRESGAIEQDADIVMFLYRDDYYNPETENPNITELIIAKHRNGATGKFELAFIPELTKFVNFERN